MSKNKTTNSNPNKWQFNGPLLLLEQRAFLLAAIRRFFAQKKVLEVQTPVLSSAANTDVQIEMFSSQSLATDSQTPIRKSYLRTSPEFFHKRLLASGAGDLFEIAPVFRRGERTSLHNPEFTLLEWYRLDFTLFDLIDDVIELIQFLWAEIGLPERGQSALAIESISYQDLFIKYAGFDPFDVDSVTLQKYCYDQGYSGSQLSRTQGLDFIFSIVIQPQLTTSNHVQNKQASPGLVIHHFPAEMAALAQLHPESPDRCLRFEFLWNGVELTNGYQELTDAKEQLQRFEQDNQARLALGKSALPIDRNLIAALQHGLPACSGVALGIERLMMCLFGYDSIDQVMGFVAENS